MSIFESATSVKLNGKDVEKIAISGVTVWSKIVNYNNLLPFAVTSDGVTPYVGENGEKGYKTGYRINSSRNEIVASGYCCTGFIPVTANDVVRIKNITKSSAGSGYVMFYESDLSTGASLAYESALYGNLQDGVYIFTPADVTNNPESAYTIAWMRISTGVIDSSTIITVNEEIT